MQKNDSISQLIRAVSGTTGASAGETRSVSAEVATVLAPLASGSEAQAGSGPAGSSDALAQNTGQLVQLRSAYQTQVDTIAANTLAITENTAKSSSGGAAATAGNIAKTLANVITGGFALNPIVSGLMSLFSGGQQQSAPAPLTRFSLPAAVHAEAGFSGSGGAGPVDYGQNGLPRPPANQMATTQVTVQVNAMDSQSFLDRSSDIASAVRRAMLESSSLNDVVQEL